MKGMSVAACGPGGRAWSTCNRTVAGSIPAASRLSPERDASPWTSPDQLAVGMVGVVDSAVVGECVHEWVKVRQYCKAL